MRIAFFALFPPTLWQPGGGEHQLRATRTALGQLGIDVDLFDVWSPRADYDIMHVFGSTYQLSDFVRISRAQGMPTIVSSLIYSRKPSIGFHAWRLFDRLIPLPTTYTLRHRIYHSADRIIATTKAEARQLHTYFRVPMESLRVIPVGVDRALANAVPDSFLNRYRLKDFILMVARVTPHKGQLLLYEQHQRHFPSTPLVFIGPPDPREPTYAERLADLCRQSRTAHYLGEISDRALLHSAYATAAVHVLPSRSESGGMTSMEAGMAGAQVVSTYSPPIYEHLGDNAHYCDPGRPHSVTRAIDDALSHPKPLRDHLLHGYTWEHIASKTIDVYREVLAEV